MSTYSSANPRKKDWRGRSSRSSNRSLASSLLRAADPFWQARYYDFNLWSERKFVEKLRYIHRNQVTRGLVARPEDWRSSSFRHYATGEVSLVEIESQWTARARERRGIFLTVRVRSEESKDPPKRSLDGAPSRAG